MSHLNCCLFRLSALGDITHVLPLVRALQQQRPDWRLSWVIGAREQQLFSGLDNIELIPFHKRKGELGWRQLRQQLSTRRFDLLLHLQTSLRANLLSTRIRARRRLGWDRQRSREGHRWMINEPLQEYPPQHQVQGFLAFARHLGLAATEPCWDFPISDEATAFARKALPGEQPTLIISPCSSHPLRDWTIAGYQAVARHAIEHHRMRVMVCGGPSEREQDYGQQIAKAHPAVINFVGRDRLHQLPALLQRATLVLSPDSGPAHIANAVGTPVIGLHAATWSRRSGPYNSLHLCVDRFAEAASRFRNQPPERLRWGSRIEEAGVMELISTDDVIEQLDSAVHSLSSDD